MRDGLTSRTPRAARARTVMLIAQDGRASALEYPGCLPSAPCSPKHDGGCGRPRMTSPRWLPAFSPPELPACSVHSPGTGKFYVPANKLISYVLRHRFFALTCLSCDVCERGGRACVAATRAGTPNSPQRAHARAFQIRFQVRDSARRQGAYRIPLLCAVANLAML